MSKLIRHEFRSTARLMLPLYLLLLVSGLFLSLVTGNTGLVEKLNLFFLLIFFASLFGIGFMCLFILIRRFYTNTMTDRAYLTMTLPLNVHEFIWGELIISLIWFLLSALAIGCIGILCLTVSGMLSLPDSFQELSFLFTDMKQLIAQSGIRWIWVMLFGMECFVGGIAAVLSYCLRFYLAMVCGQMFHRHRLALSVVCYLLIGALLSALFLFCMYLLSHSNISVTDANIHSEVRLVLFLGLGFDLAALAAAALQYFPTAALLKNKLNLI